MTFDRGIRTIGRQAQMIAVLASMVVHNVESVVPSFTSLALEDVLRVSMRAMEVPQTLKIGES